MTIDSRHQRDPQSRREGDCSAKFRGPDVIKFAADAGTRCIVLSGAFSISTLWSTVVLSAPVALVFLFAFGSKASASSSAIQPGRRSIRIKYQQEIVKTVSLLSFSFYLAAKNSDKKNPTNSSASAGTNLTP